MTVALGEPGDRLRQIMEIQRDVAAADLDLHTVMELICARTQQLTNADSASILLLEDGELVHRAATGSLTNIVVGERLSLETTFAGEVYRSNRSAICEDALAYPLASARGIKSMICVPLRHRDVTIGLLSVISRTPHSFAPEDLDTLELLSVVLSSALSHASEFEALTRFRTIFEGASVGISRVDETGRLIEVNPALERMLGYSAAELALLSFKVYTHPDDVDRNLVLFDEMMAGERDSYQLEKRYYRKDGELIWSQVTSSLVRDIEGTPFAISMIENITERKTAEEELRRQSELNEHQALHDGLTDLPNRALFHDRIERAIATAKRDGGRVAVLVMDLDRFKEVNDSLGHLAGDMLLQELGRRLQHCVRASDTVARLGGDEFGMLFPQHCEIVDVIQVLERIRQAVEEPMVLEDLPFTIESSTGVAFWPDDGDDVDILLQRSEAAMYSAKDEGLAHAFYDKAADSYDPTRLRLVGELHRAIDEHELVLYYQPKLLVASGELDSVEALVRWSHPTRGLVSPDDFVPLAQQTGLIKPLTLYVVDEALRQCRQWQQEGLTIPISVNLSTRNLRDVEFPGQVEQLLEKWGVLPALLQFEITESAMMTDPIRAKIVLDRLAATGIRISIDDFGTGYSSLQYLKRLPATEIKIDRSFVMHMDTDEEDAAIVRSTIDLAKNLGLDVVAEGVESEEIWDRLRELGCTIAQGYYLSRPVPAEELRPWLRARGLSPSGAPIALRAATA